MNKTKRQFLEKQCLIRQLEDLGFEPAMAYFLATWHPISARRTFGLKKLKLAEEPSVGLDELRACPSLAGYVLKRKQSHSGDVVRVADGMKKEG